MYLVIKKCVTAVKVSNFSGHYLRNRSTLGIGVLGYIGILYNKGHSPEVLHIPPGTPCIFVCIWTALFHALSFIIPLFIKQTFDVTTHIRQFQEMLIHLHRVNSKVHTEQCILAFCIELITTLGLHKERKMPVKKNVLCYRDGCVDPVAQSV